MIDVYPSLTPEGRNRIKTAVSHYSSDKELFEDLLADILGAESFKRFNYFLFPRTLRGVDLVTGGKADKYVLKVCSSHLKEKSHDCRLQQEVWVWKEAVRRGNDHLFAPIAESEIKSGWAVMAFGYPLGDLDYAVPIPQSPDKISLNEVKNRLFNDLRANGWIPYDAEAKAINEEPVIIDYERIYPENMFGGHYVHSFPGFYEHELYSSETKQAARENSRPEHLVKRSQIKQRLQNGQ